MDSFLLDLRFALRTLRRRPAYTAAAILALGLGIGAATAVFGVVNGVLLRPLPYADPGRLVTVWMTFPHWRDQPVLRDRWQTLGLSYDDYTAVRDRTTSFQGVAVYDVSLGALTGLDVPREAAVGRGTASLLPLLGLRPALGRWFLPGEEGPGAPALAVLSHERWRSWFGADANVLGRAVTLDGAAYTIVGVAPAGLPLHSLAPLRNGTRAAPDVWIPIGVAGQSLHPYSQDFEALARLRPEVPLARATADAERVLAAAAPPGRRGARVLPRREAETGEARGPVLLLFAAVMALLLIACGNVAALALGEAAGRTPELAARVALGASRGRLVRQLLTESAALAALGCAAGVALAAAGTRALVALAPPEVPRLEGVGLSRGVLAFAVAAALLTGVLSGLAPALGASGDAPAAAAAGGGARATRRGAGRLTPLLVAAQLALSTVLAVTAGLLGRSLLRQRSVDPGFRAEGVLTFRLDLGAARYDEPAAYHAFVRQLGARLAALPGVRSASAGTGFPFAGRPQSWSISPDPAARLAAGSPTVQRSAVLPGWFAAAGVPLLAGRGFTEADRAGAAPAALVGETMARRFWPDESPLGKQFRTPMGLTTIVGVVGDVRAEALERAPEAAFYEPLLQGRARRLTMVVRAAGTDVPPALAAAARRAVWELDPQLPVEDVAPATRLVARSMADEHYRATLLALFGAAAALLAAVGLAGVTARAVAQRLREIAIRMAVGCTPRGAVALVLGRSLAGAAAGIALGALASLGASRGVAHYLYGVRTWDPRTYALAAAGLVAVCAAAAWLPARRAGRADPGRVLRAP